MLLKQGFVHHAGRTEYWNKQERYQTSHEKILRRLPLWLRLTLTSEWKAQLQRPFPMPLFIEIPHAGQQEIIQRNHSHQFSVVVLDDWHPRKTRLCHAENNHPQRFVRTRHNGFAHDMAQ